MTSLPPPVRSYLERVLPDRERTPAQVRLAQVGELRLKPGGRWLRFTASQTSSVYDLAFSWRAQVKVIPWLSLHVVDRLSGERGASEVRLLRLPIQRDSGPHVLEGAALRYLAELPWNPYAMLENDHLEWRDLDADAVEVTTSVASSPIRLHFGEDGNIVKASTDARPRTEHGRIVTRGWGGAFSAYVTLAGIQIPTHAEVTWDLPDGPWTWFRCAITALAAG